MGIINMKIEKHVFLGFRRRLLQEKAEEEGVYLVRNQNKIIVNLWGVFLGGLSCLKNFFY